MTPFAVTSLIAGAIGAQSDLAEVFTQLGWLVAATVVGLVTQFSVVYCGLYMGLIRSNPFKYYAQLIPAYATAFGGSSSAAAIPQSLSCIKKTGQVPDGVASFVIPLGATINMDGKCIQLISLLANCNNDAFFFRFVHLHCVRCGVDGLPERHRSNCGGIRYPSLFCNIWQVRKTV